MERLPPDTFGSYVNGTWTQLASFASRFSPLYHSSAVLPDGRVIIMGGEYNFLKPRWTSLQRHLRPHRQHVDACRASGVFWGFGPFPQTIGDSQSVVLFDGTFMQANCCTTQTALLDAKTLTCGLVTGSGKFDINDEEGWTLLPNKQSADSGCTRLSSTTPRRHPDSEIYNPASGKWRSRQHGCSASWDSAACLRRGSGCITRNWVLQSLRPDGTVFYTGSNTSAVPATLPSTTPIRELGRQGAGFSRIP